MKWNAYAYGRHMREQGKKKRSWRRSGKPNWKVNVKIYESLNWKAGKMRRRRRLHWLAAESGKTWLKVVEHATETETAREREKGKRGRPNKNVAAASADAGATTTLTIWMLQLTDTHTAQRRAADTSACIYVCPNIDLSHGQGRSSWWWWWDDDDAEIIRSCCSCGKNRAHYAANKLNEMRVKLLPSNWLIDWLTDWQSA